LIIKIFYWTSEFQSIRRSCNEALPPLNIGGGQAQAREFSITDF